MERKPRVAPYIAAVFLLLPAVFSPVEAPRAQRRDDPSAIVMTACTVCHSTERICGKLGEKDAGEWTRTIEWMKARGADVASEDIPALAQYLAGLEPGSRPVCR